MTLPLRVEWNSLGLTHWKHSPSDPDELLDLGLLLLVGPLLLALEWLLEPDLEWEEDIIKVLLAVNRKEIKITTFFQNMITEAICLKLHYTIKYSRKSQFTIEHFHSIKVWNVTKCHCWYTNETRDASIQKVRLWAGAKYGVAVNFFTTMLDRSRLRDSYSNE